MRPAIGITSRFILLAFLLLLSVDGSADADSLEAKEKALKVIADFADHLCTTIPLTGGANNLELSGKAKFELSELLKKIAPLGTEGAAEYQTSDWQGVLQKDLAEQLNNSRNCKLEVFKTLKNRLLTVEAHCSQDGSMPPVPSAPPPGCVLTVEWWYPPNPTPCGLWITHRGVEFKEGVAGHWWHEYDSTVAAHIQAFKAKDTSKPCGVVDYR
jgi:hypothetical protein